MTNKPEPNTRAGEASLDSAVEQMGKALFNLSSRLKLAGTFTVGSLGDRKAVSYEKVVLAWQKLTGEIERAKLPTWDHYAEEHVDTRPLPQPSELVELVGCISKTAWLLRLNLEDGDKRMAIENSNTMLSLIERGTAPDDLPSARTLHAEIAACITRQEGLGGDSLVCSLGSYLATRITQLEAQIAKLQARLEVVPGWSEDAEAFCASHRNDRKALP